MIPIKHYSNSKLTLTIDPFAFVVNSFALGDVIASAAVIKHLVDTYYVTPESYIVVAKQSFRPLFHFIPDANFRDFDSTEQPFWGIPSNWPVGLFNKKSTGTFVRNTPKAMKLTDYASLAFADTILDDALTNYVPLKPVDVTHFGVDWTRAVILVTTYRDSTRRWPANEILKFAEQIKQRNLIPVFIGRTEMDQNIGKAHLIPKTNLPADISQYGVDLRNRTSLEELASIMAQSVVVCGVDSGPIHLAGTTQTPIICGYPTVSAKYRVPNRVLGTTQVIEPRIECGNCESRWRTSYHNFENCFFKHADCCKEFTAERFTELLDRQLGINL